MKTIKNIKIPIFEYRILVIVFDAFSDLKDLPYDIENSKGFTLDFGKYSIIGINTNYPNTVVHESEHLKNSIWKYIGYTPQRDNDEVDAYLVTYIYNRIMNVFYQHVEH